MNLRVSKVRKQEREISIIQILITRVAFELLRVIIQFLLVSIKNTDVKRELITDYGDLSHSVKEKFTLLLLPGIGFTVWVRDGEV